MVESEASRRKKIWWQIDCSFWTSGDVEATVAPSQPFGWRQELPETDGKKSINDSGDEGAGSPNEKKGE